MKRYKTILTIAGSDSVGGAGIQADIKTSGSLRVFAMSAITAVTAQNTQGVFSYKSVGSQLLSSQIAAVCSDVRPDAIKIGMVPDAPCADAIADAIEQFQLTNVVLDPVMVATSGDALSDGSAISVLASRVFPLSTIITPNLIEAKALLGESSCVFPTEQWPMALAQKYGCAAVLVKGGHMEGDTLADILYSDGGYRRFCHKKIDTKNTHGTGCSLSSAIACGLAKGEGLTEAVEKGIAWLQQALVIGKDYEFGHGHGPVYFF